MSEEGKPAEGSLQAPERHPLRWREEAFWDEHALHDEMERVFDICHGCRRCFSLCNAFPTLFELIDESETFEIDGVDRADYGKVVEQCYLCDMCFMTKCPYVPPHPWQVDFPKLMQRAKAVEYRKRKAPLRHRLLTAPDRVGKYATLPVVVNAVNAANGSRSLGPLREKALGVHRDAQIPAYDPRPLRRRLKHRPESDIEPRPAGRTTGKVALFATCYCDYNEPGIGEDLIAVFEHNGIPVRGVSGERCCGMPKLEIGDLDSAARLKEINVPRLAALVGEGWDIVAPVPSCVLMFKQELPLMFPEDEQVRKVRDHVFDPFEYLHLRHKAGRLNTEFKNELGDVSYHVACHQRVQNIGPRTRDVLKLVPGTKIEMVERCSGHDGTYGVRKETFELARKIARPAARRLESGDPDRVTSDCPLAGKHLTQNMSGDRVAGHPITLLRHAYGI